MRETAYAKINLALHVRGRQPDGYHDIETLFAFAEHGDELNAAEADCVDLDVDGPFAGALDPAYNLILAAAERLRAARGATKGARLALHKRLPVAAGLGGGSADAAAALRLLVRLWGLTADDEALIAIAATLGADVPACVRSVTVRGERRGDRLISQDGSGFAGMPVLLVNPGVAVSTAAVFAAWDGVDRGALPILSPLATAIEGRNDLQAAACAVAPAIKQVLAALDGAVVARMSGSGATCFALFDSAEDRDDVARTIAASWPDWWQMSSRIR